ncbi:hypothetical protein GCM10009718_04430 [Isoptericola halotolerans]|uniref:SPW repeat-containing protein n=1 Tax=Isoptericola halotolerans TaxID=300560 RepID=A0ABX2A400_9MICO|nr:hypothetical protein [Isoptericola halotolerans]NOV96633.1 hypothetical protein [Isoptericola halotolerans]
MASTTSASLGNLLRAGGRTGKPRKQILHPGSIGLLVGALVVVVGSLLPWVLTPFGSISGTAGPGLWTLCAGFVAVAGALLPRRWVAISHGLVAGGGAGFVAVWQLVRLGQVSATTDAWGQAMPGIGLVMVAGGAVILLATTVRLIRTPAVAPPA